MSQFHQESLVLYLASSNEMYQPPDNHVIVKFLLPRSGTALVAENALILLDRDAILGDVVKRSVSDAQSGTVIRYSYQCRLRPIYTGLPYSGSRPWTHKAEDDEITVPSDEITSLLDYHPGMQVAYQGWFGEVLRRAVDITVRLDNGSVVHVQEPDDLEVPDTRYQYDPSGKDEDTPLVSILRRVRQRKYESKTKPNHTRKAEVVGYHLGQTVYTKKSNLRLGRWVIGHYSASQAARGVIVDIQVIALGIDWLSENIFTPRRSAPPPNIGFRELSNVVLYNGRRGSNTIGSRHPVDPTVGNVVKFRDLTGAALKYSKGPPNNSTTGVFRRIPKEITQNFEMNNFHVVKTTGMVDVQWQDGSLESCRATSLIPYLNVDEHDLWPGEKFFYHTQCFRAEGTALIRFIHFKSMYIYAIFWPMGCSTYNFQTQ